MSEKERKAKMHAYYKKNREKLHKMVSTFMELIKVELEQISGKPYNDLLMEIWDIYEKEMMEHFPYIGGDEASGTKNLTGAYVFVAMGEVLKKYGASMEQIGHQYKFSKDCAKRTLSSSVRFLGPFI